MHYQGNIFQQLKEKKVLDKDGKVDALGPYGKMKLTGQEVADYFRKNKVKDSKIKKAVEVALDLAGADTIARKEIAKFYGNAILKNKDVQKALQYANESVVNFELGELSEEILTEGKNLMPAIQKIVDDKGAAKVGGVMVDMFTASVLTQAYAKVSDANKKKMEASNIQVLVKLAQKVMGMKEETVTEINTKMPEKVRTQILTHMNKLMDLPYGSPAFKKEKKEMEALQKKYAIKRESMIEGKYAKYSDLLLKKAREMQAIDKAQNKSKVANPSLNALKSINKEIEKEMKKLGITEEIITEAKELDPATVGKIASMTDKNDHNGSLLTLANAMKDKKSVKMLQLITQMHKLEGSMTDGMMSIRRMIEQDLMKKAQKTYSNYDEIYGAF